MDHLGIPLDVALALRLVRAQPRRGRGALPHRAAPHGCRNQRREPRDLPNQAAIFRATCVYTSVSLLERHSLRSHSGYTRARHPVTLFHGNEATLPSPHHKDQPGSHALSTLGCTRKIQKHTRAHRTLTQNTHTHAQRTALHVRDRNPTAEGTPWVAHEGLQPLDPLCEELLHSATRYEAAPARRRCSSSQALDPRLPRGTREPFGSETLHH